MGLDSQELAVARETLRRAVALAGELQLSGRGGVAVEAKGERDIVTDVDRRCEAEVALLLKTAHPAHALLAEEGSSHGERLRGPVWMLDPVDGSKNYAHGSRRFACSLALVWDGVPLLGAVFAPALEELYLAERGVGATCNGAPIHVSTTRDLAAAAVATSLTIQNRPAARQVARVEQLVARTRAVRVNGCASLDLCEVASGRLDAYFEEGLNPWDTAAGALIVREAGGVVTAFDGSPFEVFGHETLAATPAVGAALAAFLRSGA